jgi:lipoprotein-releasing system permease protein
MKLSLYIAKRLSLKGKKSFSRLIVILSVVAVSISLAVMILSMATVTGFQYGIKEKVVGFGGHIEVSKYLSHLNHDYPLLSYNDTLHRELEKIEGVSNVNKVLTKPGIIKAKEDNAGIIIKGVDSNYNWSYMDKHIIEGRHPNYSSTGNYNEVLISKHTAKKLKLSLGDKLRVYFIDEKVRAMAPVIVGIYNTGLEEYDKIFSLGNLKTLQRIFAKKEDKISHYEIKIKNFKDYTTIQERINRIIPIELQSTNAMDRNPQIFDWLKLLDLNVYIVIVLMLVVAAFNIITALLILVLERVNMIGILKTLGETNWNIRNIFVYKLLYINGLGLLFGNILGIGLALLQQKTGLVKLSQETYVVNEVLIRIMPMHIILVNLGTLLISFISIWLASRLVTNIQPAQTIKFE